jgi:hypothetical protein
MGERWEWTKRFRIWEADRKVFLEPENWLEPEAKDDAAQPPAGERQPRFGRPRRRRSEPEQRD